MQENARSAGLIKAAETVLAALCVVVSLFHIFVAVNSSISVVQQRVIHVMAILLVFFVDQVAKTSRKSMWKTIVNMMLLALMIVLSV